MREHNFLKKHPGHVPIRSQGGGYDSGPGYQNVAQSDIAIRQVEALRNARVNKDAVKMQPQVIRIRAEGPRPPVVPVPNPVLRGLPAQRGLNAYESGQGSQRKLLVEKDMPGGCLSHKTGVACGALALYLRYLVSPSPLSSFYTDTHASVLGDKEPFNNVLEFLGKKLAKENVDDGAGEEEEYVEEREEEEEEEEEEGEERNKEEDMYPDADRMAKEQKKVVHFGANGRNAALGSQDEENNDQREDRRDVYKDEKEEEEEEGPDYIKRIEEDTKAANTKNADDTEYTYYEDSDNSKGVFKKHKNLDQPQAQPNFHGHSDSAAREPSIELNSPTLGQRDSPPAKALVVLLSAISLALIFLVCKFMRKRRIHLKYGSRAFHRL